MKRSEMVDLFAEYLAGNYDEEWINRKTHVGAILNFLEVSGMLPPRGKYYPNRDNPNFPDLHNEVHYDNVWEDE